MADDRVKILVARRIGAAAIIGLANPAGAVDKRLVEPALVRLIRLLVAEVPLAENTAGVAGLLEYLWQRNGLQRHAFALEDSVGYAVFHRVATGHQRAASRRASGAHEKPRESCARVVQLIEVGRLDPWVPMPTDRPVALVVCDNEDDVGGFCSYFRLVNETAKRT